MQNNYIFFNGQRVARVDSAGTVHFYFSDHLGSHGVVENATGSACEQDIDYYPYGGVEEDYCPSVAQNYKFTGKERDAESGLDNFGARYDASSLGRFMTPDWAAKPTTVPYASFGDPQTLNLYTYVENGPLNRIDADGHLCTNPNKGCGSDQAKEAQDSAQNTITAAVTAAPTTMEAVGAVVKPLIQSAEGALASAGTTLLDVGASALLAVTYLASPGSGGANNSNDTIQGVAEQKKDSAEPAPAAGGAGASQGGGTITGFTRHGLNQAISRDGVGVSNRAMLDAMKNPKEVVPQSNGTTLYIGHNAVVLTNAQGKVVTTWATGSAGQR